MKQPYEIGDFIEIEWHENKEIDILRILREEYDEGTLVKIWCDWIYKNSTTSQNKNDEVFLFPSEIINFGTGKLRIITDEKEKLAIILKAK
jgi:hypothetical protein